MSWRFLSRAVGRTAAARHRPHARDQLARRERLGDVVVGAQLEAEHLVALVHTPRHHDHGDAAGLGVLLEAAADLPAVELGHHDVEEDHVGLAVPGVAHGIGAVAQDGDVVAFLVEVEADQLRDVLLVLDHQDPTEALAPGRAGGLSGGAATLGGGRHLSGRSHRTGVSRGDGYGVMTVG